MELKVAVDAERAGEKIQLELARRDNGKVVDVFVPSVGTHRICRFSIDPDELASALKALGR